MAKVLSPQIYDLVEKVTKRRVLEQRTVDINQFLQICTNYLNAIDNEILQLQAIKNLKERISLVGTLMHDNEYILRNMLILSHSFEVQWNNFLGRQVPITWISESGTVYLASEQAILNMYAHGQLSVFDTNKEQTYRGYIEGRAYNFNPFQLTEEKQKIQDQLTKATQNKKQLFKEGKRRYNKSRTKELNIPVKPTLYWAVDEDGNPKHWFHNVIPSAGYIGEGYVKLALDYPNISMHPVNGPTYIPEQQTYMEQLASYAYQGDNIPGIIQGDIKYDEQGNLQFAIKQGKRFHTASITGNIAIAEIFRKNKQRLKNSNMDVQKLKIYVEKFSNTTYEQLYDYLKDYLSKQLPKRIDIK